MAKQTKKNGAKAEKQPEVKASSSIKETVSARGRTFQGTVTKKFPRRVVIEFQRTVFVPKYNAFYKKKTRLHARLFDSMADQIQVGDYIEVRECRPLSKLIHFVVTKKIRSAENAVSKEAKQ